MKDKVKVLYVEDEPFLAKIVKESLESRDFIVQLVGDGDRVLPALEAEAPQIVLLDVMLPHQDGFTLGKEIRSRYPRLPIIFLTAKSQTQDLLQGFESGGNDYIRKPFSLEELIVRMQNLLQLVEPQAQQSEVVPLGAFTFFPRKYELHHGEEVRKLSHRETQLLQALTARPNRPVERKEILQAVWGDDSFFNSRTLDVYISKLRDYLKADDQVQIITLKGIGYRVVMG